MTMQVLNKGLQGLPEQSAFDLVVVGAGGAGMAAALFAAMEGASVLLVERTESVGGTTAWSAGTSWIPGSHHAAKVNPGDTLQAAYRKMKMYDVSQLPVMQGGKLIGIVDETDILLAVTANPDGFSIPVAQAMARNLETLQVTRSVEELPPIFARGMVAIVVEGEEFLGLITPIDLLQYLRKRIGHA